jgi:receptor protein-tyrosine kinase
MVTTQQREEQSGAVALLGVLRRRIGIVLICAVLLPAAALAYSLSQEKQYSTSASLLFRDPQFDQKLFGNVVFSPNLDPDREAATNVRLVSLRVVAERTARKLKTGLTGIEVKGKVEVASEGQSDVVSITATDPTPTRAAQLANTFAEEYIAFRREADRDKIEGAENLVESQLTRLTPEQAAGLQGRTLREQLEQLRVLASLQTGNAELVQTADVPHTPSHPQPVRNGIASLFLGLMLGVALALLLERLDRRLKDPREISEAFDRPILGAIPESRAIANADQDPQRLAPGEAEAFRMLRANLRYFNVDRQIDTVLITSSSPGDGKSTVAMHLASAAAGAGNSVLLIEADLRHPTLGGRLRLPGNRGLSQLLAGEFRDIEDAIQTIPVGGRRSDDGAARTLDVLVSGPIPPNPTDLIESERMRDVIQLAKSRYDLVVVDTPPTSVVSDAIPLVKEVTGVIVVCRLGKTTRESAHHLRDQLQNLEANLLGIVVNSVGRQAGYGHLYGYGYGDAAPTRKRKKGGDEAATVVSPAPRDATTRPNGKTSDSERVRAAVNGHGTEADRREAAAVPAAGPPAAEPSRPEEESRPPATPRPARPPAAQQPAQPTQRSGGLLRRRRSRKPGS